MFRWGQKEAEPARAQAPAPPERIEQAAQDVVSTSSKVFPKFLSAIRHCERPVLLDLGPVVGSNVEFLGEELACKLHIEDLYLDIEAASQAGDTSSLADALLARLAHAPASMDGILCWDMFDFLEPSVGVVVADRLATLLRQGGALYGFFGTTPIELKHYTRYVIDREDRFKLRKVPATTVKRSVLLTRDINKMFGQLTVTESVLLKTSTRETLFRRQD